ncbi:hypothetical protein DFJ74DRAFT_45444 [Hyaloraphidium curvatum]|nr:hypothetical protein DFJ74DRAFT_45444 [Hyaloraphidium curvatum]
MSAVTLCAATLPAEEGAPGFGMTAKLRLQRGDRWDDVARRLAAALAADPASLLYLDARGRPVAAADDAALGILLDDAERLFEWLRPRGMDELVCVLGGPRTDAARAVEALKWERALWGAPPSVAEGASAAAAALATGTDADQEPSISVTPAEPASAAPASAPAPSGEPALPSPSALFSDHPHHSFRRPPGALGPLPLPAVPMHMIPTPGGTYPAPSPGYSPALSPFDRPGTAGSGQGGYFPHPGYFGAYNPA